MKNPNKVLRILMILFDMIITLSNSEIIYNKECSNAIRQIGLPRKWRNDDDNENPLVQPLPIAVSVHPIVDSATNETEIWTAQRVPLLSCLHQESPQLINSIRERILVHNDGTTPYNLSFSTDTFFRDPRKFSDQQALEVDDLVFKGKLKDGFFVEAGARDFQDQSTSLYFELNYNWTGLLVEPSQFHYNTGLQTQRRVYSAETCFAFSTNPTIVPFSVDLENMSNENSGPPLQCLPLYSLLLAVGNPTVNYMSLDIEGGEFQVIQTIPWEKVDIQVISLESHFMGIRSPGSLDEVVDYLKDKGYEHIPGAHQSKKDERNTHEVAGEKGFVTNELFVRNDVAIEAGLMQKV